MSLLMGAADRLLPERAATISAHHIACCPARTPTLTRHTYSVHPRRQQLVARAQSSEASGPTLRQKALGAGAAALIAFGGYSAVAQSSDKIGEFQGNGFIFKDSVETVAVEDPEVQGVTIYITDFKRSLADKLSKDFFNEPSQASVTCASTGPVFIKDKSRVRGSEGKEVFSEKKAFSLSFQNKTLRVRRLLDEKHDTLLYVAYSTRNTGPGDDGKVSNGRYKTSVCALPISPEASQAAASAASKS